MNQLFKIVFFSSLGLLLCLSSIQAQVVKLCIGDTLYATAHNDPGVTKNYWYKDGVAYDTTAIVQISQPGTYTVYSESGAGCTSVLSAPVIVEFDTLTASNDIRTTSKNTSIDIDILTNDNVPACSTPTIPSITVGVAAANGSTTVLADGTITYLPNAGYVGADSFFYSFEDQFGNLATAWVYITIESPLPVRLLSFEAYKKESKGLLVWKVGEELNTKLYTIERSTDALQYESLGIVLASGRSEYSFIDVRPNGGINHYRLRITDEDGSYVFSDVRTVTFEHNMTIKVYPNPTSHTVFVDLGDIWQQVAFINVSDVNGKIIEERSAIQALNSFELWKHAAQVFIITVIHKDGTTLGSFKVNKL